MFRNIQKKTPVLKSLFNNVEGLKEKNIIQPKCFPVNIKKFLKHPILKNICEPLLLNEFKRKTSRQR